MTTISIPCPLETQIKALDDAFYEWYDNEALVDAHDAHYWAEQWDNARHEPFVYTADEIYEGWGDDIEDFVSTNTLAVDKALADEVERKMALLKSINEVIIEEDQINEN